MRINARFSRKQESQATHENMYTTIGQKTNMLIPFRNDRGVKKQTCPSIRSRT